MAAQILTAALAASGLVVAPAALQLPGAIAGAETILSSTVLCGNGGSFSGSWTGLANAPAVDAFWIGGIWIPRGAKVTMSTQGLITPIPAGDGSSGQSHSVMYYDVKATNGVSLLTGGEKSDYVDGGSTTSPGPWSSAPVSWTNTGSTGRVVRLTVHTAPQGPTLAAANTWTTTVTVTGGSGGVMPPCTAAEYGLPNLASPACHCSAADPVNTATGGFYQSWSDLSLGGRGPAVVAERTYSSLANGVDGPFGYGWRSAFQMSLSESNGVVTVAQENGSQLHFFATATGYEAPPRFDAILTKTNATTFTLRRNGNEVFTFVDDPLTAATSEFVLAAASDLSGNSVAYGYTASKLTSVTAASGRVLTIGWSGSRITSITAPSASLVTGGTPAAIAATYTYDGAGNLETATDPAGGIWTYTYDASHRLKTIREPRHHTLGAAAPVVENSYNSTTGRLEWQKDRLGRQTTFAYATDAEIPSRTTTTVTDPAGHVVRHEFSNGFVTATVNDPTGTPSTWSYEVDPSTLGTSKVTDPNGNVTSTTFDGRGRKVSVTTPKGTTAIQYTDESQPLTITDTSNVTTDFSYDLGTDRVRTVSRPITPGTGTSLVQTSYADPANPGLPTSITDARGKTWTSTYSAAGDPESTTDPLGNKTTTAYNQIGWPLSSVAPAGNPEIGGVPAQQTTSYRYNARGEILAKTDPLGFVTEYDRDLSGNVTFRRDPTTSGTEQTGFVINAAGELVTINRPGGSAVTTEYWPNGQVKTQRDAANVATTYAYDGQARLQTTADEAGRVTTLGYDPGGRLITRQQPGGNCAATPTVGCIKYRYTTGDELEKIDYSDPATPDVTYTYDALGRKKTMSGSAPSSWDWDSIGRLLKFEDPSGAVTYTYDDAGPQASSITYPGGKTVAREIDDAGRLWKTDAWTGGETTFGYDPNSNHTTTDTQATGGVEDTYGYDRANRMTAATVRQGATVLSSLVHARDPEGMVSTTTATGVPGAADTYGYNGLDQITTSNAGPFTYDTADNLSGNGVLKQKFNAAHELCYVAFANTAPCGTPPSTAITYTYDGRGNRTRAQKTWSAPTTYAYNQADQLIQAKVPATPAGAGQYHDLSNSPLLAGNPAALYVINNLTVTGPTTLTKQITGSYGVPAGASSVVLRLNAGNVSAPGAVTVYPTGTTPAAGTTSMLVDPSEWATELAVSDLDASGRLNVAVNAPMTLNVEVVGWYSATAAAGGLTFTAITPSRAFYDSVGATTTTPVTVTGVGGVPASGVSAVAVTLHAINPSALGYLTAYSGTTRPSTATLAYDSPQSSAFAIVPVVNGQIQLYSSAGVTAAVDISGWYTAVESGDGSIAHPVTPANVADTIAHNGVCNGGICNRLAANTPVSIKVAGTPGIPANGAGAVGLVIHTWWPAANGVLAAYPTGAAPFTGGQLTFDTSNPYTSIMTIVPIGPDGNITLWTSAAVDVWVQTVGWYEPSVKTYSYAYAGDGLRHRKTGPDGTVTTFTWDRSTVVPLLIAEGIDAPGTSSDRVVRYVYGPGGFVLADVTTPLTGADIVRWYHHDQLGSTASLTNSTGAMLATTSYTPYGGIAQATGTATTPIGWAGEYRDPETGLSYLRARYYDPATGQFLSNDPLEPQTRESYGYVGNNPVNGTDPSGLCSEHGGIFGGIRDTFCEAGEGDLDEARDAAGRATVEVGRAAYRNRGTLATIGAAGACLAPGVGFAACGYAQAGAFAVRAEQRIDEHGFSNSLRANLVDGTMTYLTVGMSGAWESLVGPWSGFTRNGVTVGALGRWKYEWFGRLIPAGWDIANLFSWLDELC